MATSFEEVIPNDSLTKTFTLPINTPESRQVCDLELLGTASVPYKPKGKWYRQVKVPSNAKYCIGYKSQR